MNGRRFQVPGSVKHVEDLVMKIARAICAAGIICGMCFLAPTLQLSKGQDQGDGARDAKEKKVRRDVVVPADTTPFRVERS